MKTNRKEMLFFRVKKFERRRLQTAADAAGMYLSEWLRDLALSHVFDESGRCEVEGYVETESEADAIKRNTGRH